MDIGSSAGVFINPESYRQAREIQLRLAPKVIVSSLPTGIRFVAGVDVGFPKQGEYTRAAVVVLRYPGLEMVDQQIAIVETRFPYVPGYLSFREMPAILVAMKELQTRPDLIFCDGQGLAHPRRFGIACHLGVTLDIATIGVGKSRLLGEFEEPGNRRADYSRLMEKGQVIGRVVRTRKKVKPVFLSVGHRCDLPTAMQWLLKCTTRYKLPEPIRLADRLASERDI